MEKISRKKDIEKLHNQFFASCPKGMEGILEKELLNLGIKKIHVEGAGVSFEASNADPLRVIFHSRIASRVYKKLFHFRIRSEEDLYLFGKEIKWKSVILPTQSFKINCVLGTSPELKHSIFRSPIFLAQKLKDSIADWYLAETGSRPNVERQNTDVSLLLHIHPSDNAHATREEATILVDLCGTPMSHRGYRAPDAPAPLRENLAAAIILSTNWKPHEDILVDPMCGTGTLLIEAALIAAAIPPSYLRILKRFESGRAQWAFELMPLFMKDAFLVKFFDESIKTLAGEIEGKITRLRDRASRRPFLFGSDIDPKSVEQFQHHLRVTKLGKTICVSNADALKLLPPGPPPGIVVCNPPYGERLAAEIEDLEALYYGFGENLKKNYKGFRAYVFTGNPSLRKKISLQTSERIPFFNGSIECRLLKYDLF